MTNMTTEIALDSRKKMKESLEVAKQKLAALKEITTSTMKTSGKFSWRNETTDSQHIDVFKEKSIFTLCRIVGYIKRQEEDYTVGANLVNLHTFPELRWCGYTLDQWLNDIQIRIRILSQKEEEEKLQRVINILSSYMTEEDRLLKDLEEVESLLK